MLPGVSRSTLLAAASILALTGALVGCGGGGGEASGSGDTLAATAVPTGPPGAAVYARSCARCHGRNAEGKGDSPALDSVRLATLGDQRLRLTIASGKGRMPGFSNLSQQEVDDLVAYLNTRA
jgi:mono/diheme cytochrome c family protein